MEWLKRMPSRVDRVIVVLLVITGLLLPFAVAIGVKLYLRALGTPTVPWSDIAMYAIVFGPIGSVIAAAPLIILAVLYRQWTFGMLGRLSRATPLQGRLVVLSAFAGCAAGMVHVFIGVFWDFDAMALWFIPGVVVMYLPWMGGGLVVGVLLAVIAGLVGRHGGVPPRRRGAGEGGGSGSGRRPGAGASPASARYRATGDGLEAGLAEEAASRARSLGGAVGVAAVVGGAAVALGASPEGSLALRFLLGLAAVCFLWAAWAILRGAWLLGTKWKVGFFACLIGGPPVLLVYGLIVFGKLRRMSPRGGRGRPAGLHDLRPIEEGAGRQPDTDVPVRPDVPVRQESPGARA